MSEDQTTAKNSGASTRRQVLRATGAAGLVGALGVAGWTTRLLYLHDERERTSIGTDDPARSSLSGPHTKSVPAERLSAELDRFSGARSNVGLQACVRFADGTRWCGVAGEADHDDGVPLSFAHHLYVGSVTKFYTATFVLTQIQRGALSLSDTIDEWVDLEYAGDITVRMLLNHTSGVPSYTTDPWFIARYLGLPNRTWKPGELVDVLRGTSLLFEPGTRHEYSNSNYLLLGVILEAVTGRTYQSVVRRLLREQAGLDRTYYRDYPATARIANAYDESIFGLGRRNLTGFRESLETGAYAAGGILSTAPDAAEFVHAVFSGELLTPETLAAMRTFVEAPDPDVTTQVGYGLGVRHLRIDGEDLYGHTGTIPGYSAIAMSHDDPSYTIAVLSNRSTIDQAGIYAALQRVVLETIE